MTLISPHRAALYRSDIEASPKRRARLRVAVVAVLALLATASLAFTAGSRPLPGAPAFSAPMAAGPSFSFGAVGDLNGIGNPDVAALAKRAAASDLDFLLVLGDVGYTPDEEGWCTFFRQYYPNVTVIAGNHDTTESGPGDIGQTVIYCPFVLGVPVMAGPGTPGYGYEYYFDYPDGAPLARVIMISPGVTGTTLQGPLGYDYSVGGTHYAWVVDAVNNARANGIPWVIVGSHKMCITVGTKPGCAPSSGMGQAIFDKLVEMKVDLILTAHDHTYQRSKQLALNANCPTVASGGSFDADCVAASSISGAFAKGVGSVNMIQGAGAYHAYDVRIDGTDPEIGYFEAAMGANTNTQGKSFGVGYAGFTVTTTTVSAETEFCPPGRADGAGQCPNDVASTFQDSFMISGGEAPPTPVDASFTATPTWPQAGVVVSFDAASSAGEGTLQARWDWMDDGTWDTAWSTTLASTHAYGTSGTFTVRLEIEDSTGARDAASQTIVVDSDAPATSWSASGTSGSNGWFTSPVTVTLWASDSLSGVAETTFRWDAGPWQPYAGPTTVDGDATHTIEFFSSDRAGNDEPVRTSYVALDATAARTSHSLDGQLADGGGYFVDSVTVSLAAIDDTSGVASSVYRIDEGSWQVYPGPVLVDGNGSHRFDYSSTDRAGNVEAWKSVSLTIGADAAPPRTTENVTGTVGGNRWYITPVSVALTASSPSGASVIVSVRIDGGPWLPYPGPIIVRDGRHVIEWFATDEKGRVEATRSLELRVDATPPRFLTASPTGVVTNSAVTVIWQTSDGGAGNVTYATSIDGGFFRSDGDRTALDLSLPDGPHVVIVKATDEAGNEAIETIRFQIDSNPFSPTGPHSGIPLYVLFAFLATVAVTAVARRRRRTQLASLGRIVPDPREGDDSSKLLRANQEGR